jgi:hypothetical protein
MQHVTKLLIERIIPYLGDNACIQLYNVYKKHEPVKEIYRADPSYGTQSKAWHDWALIDWDWSQKKPLERNKVPGRLIIYFEIDSSCTLTHPIKVDQYCTISEPGAFVLLQSLVENLDVAKPNRALWSKLVQASYGDVPNYFAYSGSSLIYWSCLEMETETLPLLRVFSVHSIHSPIAAVPYDIIKLEQGLDQEQWLIVAPEDRWKEKFIDEMDEFRQKRTRRKESA